MNSNKEPQDKGKCGWDTLSKFICFVGVIFLAFVSYGFFIGLSLVIYAFWRSQSKKIFERKKEEKFFLDIVEKLRKMLRSFNENALFYEVRKCFSEWAKKQRNKGRHPVVICPKCKTKIRLEKQKNESMIWCPKCSARLIRKTHR